VVVDSKVPKFARPTYSTNEIHEGLQEESTVYNYEDDPSLRLALLYRLDRVSHWGVWGV